MFGPAFAFSVDEALVGRLWERGKNEESSLCSLGTCVRFGYRREPANRIDTNKELQLLGEWVFARFSECVAVPRWGGDNPSL